MSKILYFDTTQADNGTYVEPDPSIAAQSHVKDGYIYQNATSHEWMVGTMPINMAEVVEIDPKSDLYLDNNYYIIPKGFHTGTGKVHVKDLSEYTYGTATEEDIASNKVAWVDGKRIVGTLDVSQAKAEGTAKANEIAMGKTAWVNGEKLVGELPVYNREDWLLLAGKSYTVPYGIHPGTSIISAATLESQTKATATSSTILRGSNAWVNGILVEGNFDADEAIAEKLADTDVKKSQVLSGKKFYSVVYGGVTTGEMVDHSGESPRVVKPGESFNIPEGYYNGLTIVKGANLEDVTIGTATAENILVDKTAWVNGQKITGTMPYNDTDSVTLQAGEIYTIPKGYHSGTGLVISKNLKDQTLGTAIPSHIIEGETAWVEGIKITGTMSVNKPVEKDLLAGEHYHIEEGYHDGSGWIWATDLDKQTEGNITPDTVLEGYTGWANGAKIEGVVPINPQVVITLNAGETYYIPEGYHAGNSTISALGKEYETDGTAEAKDIVDGKTAWVKGLKLTGTLKLTGNVSPDDVPEGMTFYNNDPHTIRTGTLKLIGNATSENVLSGYTFYNTDAKSIQTGTLTLSGNALRAHVLEGETYYTTDPHNIVTGTMKSNPAENIEIAIGEEYVIPAGYHTGTGKVFCSASGGTADASDIIKDKTAWAGGQLLTGTLELTGTATSGAVLAGYTFYNNNPKNIQNGSIPTQSQEDTTLQAGESITIPAGYYPNGFTISAATLEDQTPATATADTIMEGETAWANGVQLVGTLPDGDSVEY
jgi:hypothetical protein